MKEDNRGGKRENAGAKPQYGEPTKTVAFRVPESKVGEIKTIVREKLRTYKRS